MKMASNIPGMKKTVGNNTSKSIKEKTSNSKFKPKVDFLEISDDIKFRYGTARGKVLSWKTIKSFQQGAITDGWAPVKRMEQDVLEVPSFGIGSESNATLNNFFTKNELILAEIDESDYKEKQEYEAELSESRRTKADDGLALAYKDLGPSTGHQKIDHEYGFVKKETLTQNNKQSE